MVTLNITYDGRSADFPLDVDVALGDTDIRRVAIEILRGGGAAWEALPTLAENALEHFVVDRLEGGQRIYLRPKVPFG